MLLWGAFVAPSLSGQSSIRGWGGEGFDTAMHEGPLTGIAASFYCTLVQRADGRLFNMGSGGAGQAFPPLPPVGDRYVDFDISSIVGIGLLSNGTAVTWIGLPGAMAFPPPTLPNGVVFAAVSAGPLHYACVRSDGQIEVWGSAIASYPSLATAPALPSGVTYTAVESGGAHSLALRSDGADRKSVVRERV